MLLIDDWGNIKPRTIYKRDELLGLRDWIICCIEAGEDDGKTYNDVIYEVFASLEDQSKLLAAALNHVCSFPMLMEKQVEDLLVLHRDELYRMRQKSILIGLPSDIGWRYPEFQFDQERWKVHKIVETVNKILKAHQDPWGAASWWIYPHDMFREGASPANMIGQQQDQQLIVAAHALTEPVG